MIKRKIFFVFFVFILSSVALAGNVGSYSPVGNDFDALNISSGGGVYIEGLGGWNQNYYKDILPDGINSQIMIGSTGAYGTGVFGGDIGYRWNDHFSVETGGFWNLSQKYNMSYKLIFFSKLKAKSWQYYVSTAIGVRICENLKAISKIGVGYQKIDLTSDRYSPYILADRIYKSHIGPVFGGALHYNVYHNTYLIFEYMRFAGEHKESERLGVTNTNMFLFGLGYTFIT